MNINYSIRFSMLMGLLLCGMTIQAQLPLYCGETHIDTAAFSKAQAFEKNAGNRAAAFATVIRVFMHIGALDDGSNPVTTPAVLETEMNTLRASYTADNICFILAGYDYVNNSQLDTGFVSDVSDAALFDPYRIPTCINVFYLEKIKGSNKACNGGCGIGGTSLKIPNTFCLVSRGNIGSMNSVAHEVGHCMGLLHTFETARGMEKIDGSNASSAGDLITDTPADPFSFVGQPCFDSVPATCSYTGTCTDPDGKSNWTPPFANLMAYWASIFSATCLPALSLTNGQYTRVNSFLSTNTDLLVCQSQAALTIYPFYINAGYYFWTTTLEIRTYGDVELTGSSKTLIASPQVVLNNGFHASPGAGGQVKITGKVCTD